MRRGAAVPAILAALVVAPAGATPSTRIVVLPRRAAPGARVTLIGSGFPARRRIRLAECATSVWVAPRHPCAAGNGVALTTGAGGEFTTHLRVLACPAAQPPAPSVTAGTCFIGEPHILGVDETQLLGAARIVVARPGVSPQRSPNA